MTSRRSRVLAVVVVAAVCCAALGPVPVAGALAGADGAAVSGWSAPPESGLATAAVGVDEYPDGSARQREGVGRRSLARQEGPNNSALQHRNPEDVRANGDTEMVRAWLASRMSERLNRSAEELNESDYEQARELLGDDYDDLKEQYADLVEGSDDGSVERFEQAGGVQREHAAAVESYQQTLKEYRRARRAGDDERARRLARELERQARHVNRTGRAVAATTENLSNDTAGDAGRTNETVQRLTRNVTATQERVREEAFVATRLTVGAARERVSFLRPLEITGQLRTERVDPLANSSVSPGAVRPLLAGDDPTEGPLGPLDNRSVRLQVGNRTTTVHTDAEGQFSLRYRPTTLALATDRLTVRYLPRNESPFYRSSAGLNVSVAQVEPVVTVDRDPASVAFGDRLTVSGTVAGGGVGADGVPVAIAVGDRRLATVRTDDGSFALDRPLPADVAAGERPVRATVALTDRALASEDAETTVSIASTATALSVEASQANGTRVRVSGTLTADGESLAGRSVRIERLGGAVERVRTSPQGRYFAWLTLPASAVENGSATVTVRVAFDGTGTNLEDSTAETAVTVTVDDEGPGGGDGGIGDALSTWVRDRPGMAVAGAAGLALLAVGAYLRRRQHGESQSVADADAGTSGTAGITTAGSGGDSDGKQRPDPRIVAARDHLEAGAADAAVETAYAAVRAEFESALALPSALTYWGFYTACRDGPLSDDQLEQLRRLTECYERAAFAPEDTSPDRAAEVLAVVEELLGPGVGGSA